METKFQLKIGLSISLPLILILLTICSIIWIRSNSIRHDEKVNGRRIYTFDSRGRKINSFDREWNRAYDHSVVNNVKAGIWVDFNKAFNIFDTSKNERIFTNLIMSVQKSQEAGGIILKKDISRKTYKKIKIRLAPVVDSENFTLSINWWTIKKEKNTKNKLTLMDKNDVVNLKTPYIGFVAFNLNYGFSNIEELFFEAIRYFSNKNKNYYFITSGMAILTLGHSNLDNLNKSLKKLIKKISSKEKILGFNNLYNGTSYVVSKNINTKSRVNAVIGALDFCINLSIRTNTKFISKDNPEFNVDEYKAVTEANVIFRNAIRNKEISYKEIIVKKLENNRKIVLYATAEVSGITAELQKIILRNPQNKNLLINKFAEIVGIDKTISKPILIDVNDYWLAENYKKLKYKTAIYVINMYSINVISKEIIKHLKDNGFTLAIKINKINDSIRNVVRKIDPQFIIVDSELTNMQTSHSLIQLISISKMAQLLGAIIIHENPTDNMKEKMNEEIGLKHYYDI
ncbi:MHO_4530 family protein [Candidatus Mycoplasma mahonii]|uniref:MHO_4530 family protein n=1 Tax=Candidatus Mycoplasma mahonii TaxID=3004105 RepID=UPI0026E9C4E1|nr:hypothetical protein [Candidatus Mycoplasma mahonii]WKX02478.1 hypothetical protein O3I44_00130 [Candidatus Mycoplasma mahonii]